MFGYHSWTLNKGPSSNLVPRKDLNLMLSHDWLNKAHFKKTRSTLTIPQQHVCFTVKNWYRRPCIVRSHIPESPGMMKEILAFYLYIKLKYNFKGELNGEPYLI